ncbi:hypothetical protein RUM43_000694 [Polyplax serrata]|uniref:Ectopic P granules protein 5 homolog n=1 Tax=Polyplax serrata TaxID=468196 RepID=A0AAN8XSN9_POLSC
MNDKEEQDKEDMLLRSELQSVSGGHISSVPEEEKILSDSNEEAEAKILSDGKILLNSNFIVEDRRNVEFNKVQDIIYPNFCDYSTLAETVKTLKIELQNPSSPVDEISLKGDQLGVLESSNVSKEGFDISKYNFTLIIKDFMVPFSEDKLSEFYFNPELHDIKNAINEKLSGKVYNKKINENYLYNLLIEYNQSKICVSKNKKKITELKKRINICISNLWTVWEDATIKAKETFIQDYFICSFLKLKIEYHLQSLVTSCPEFTNLGMNSLVTISKKIYNTFFQQCTENIREALNALFLLQRNQVIDLDRGFLTESQTWISNLVSVLLRVGNWEDHIFLLNHIIRCPGGISEWAASFIQLPQSNSFINPFRSDEINHLMAVLHVFLSPLNQEEDVSFIKHYEDATSDSNPWTVVDSDGEIEGETNQKYCFLKENDLVSILTQIPFGYLFKTIFHFKDDGISSELISSDYLLNLFSFSTDFINILLKGLKLYSARRYKQFTKRLGQLICHIVHYTTETLAIFMSKQIAHEEKMRIQTEYDSFFLRSTKFIYSAKRHGTWQFLATMPYHMVSSTTILKLYGILQLNDNQDENILKMNFPNFEEKYSQLPEEEQYYLLTTFANMALARNISEIDFIKKVLLQLFFIGFVSQETMDISHKNVKHLLCSICSSHPFLMSEILGMQNQIFISNPTFDDRLSIQLWLQLPLDIWRLTNSDLDILSQWLIEPVQSLRCELVRIILQNLNYGICQGDLLLATETQRTIASMLMRTSVKLSNEIEQGFMRNVSNLVRYQSIEHSFNDWTWTILLKLRLHLLDKTEASLHSCLNNIGENLRSVPDIESNIELYRLVLKKNPIACFIALMTTTMGHSVPIMFDKGFQLVEILLQCGKYDPAIACLEFMTFLFLDCSDSLHNCEKFISLLSQLIIADNTYVQMAKNLISSNFPGPVLKSVECMIQNQLNVCRGLGSSKFGECLQLWLISLSKVPLWIQEPGVLHIMDTLLKNAFVDIGASQLVAETVQRLSAETKSFSETKSSLSSLVVWMNSKLNFPSLLPKGFNGEASWLSYLVIQTEFEKYERKTSIWLELLKEIHGASDKKTDIDGTLKKVCHLLNQPGRQSNSLAIYRWLFQILNTIVSHPLIPLMWQKFFYLYFFRVPGLTDRGSVGDKFFDGVLNQRLFKQLNQRLSETRDYFEELSKKTDAENRDGNYALKCLALFETYSLWMDDAKLLEPHLNVHSLPIEYNPELLGLLIHGSDTPWIDFVEYETIERSFKSAGLIWMETKSRFRSEKLKRLTGKVKKAPVNRLKEQFNSYEMPLPPPPLVNTEKINFPRTSLNLLTTLDELDKCIDPLIEKLMDYKDQYRLRMNENMLLGCHLRELSSQIYVKSETQKILKDYCSGMNKTMGGKTVQCSCSGPAILDLKYEEFKLNEEAQRRFNQYEKTFDENVERNTSHLPADLSESAVFIDITLEELKKEYQLRKERQGSDEVPAKLKQTGVDLFYKFVQLWNEKVAGTPPLAHAFNRFIEILGKTFIENNTEENIRLLGCISNNEFCGEKLIRYFSPKDILSPQDFSKNYSFAIDCTSPRSLNILTKFDLPRFLKEKEPKFSVRSSLISSVQRGLVLYSRNPTENENILQILNEHLEVLLKYDFPEHYGEVFLFLLQASQNFSIGPGVWYTFLSALLSSRSSLLENARQGPIITEKGCSAKKLKQFFVKFASEESVSLDVIKGTMSSLASHFKKERLKGGAYGLYQKYRSYLEPLFIFCGMLSYSCITKTLEQDTGSLAEKITQQLWPILSDLYAPWLIPYPSGNEPKQGSLTELSISLPWSLNDLEPAYFCTSIFTESIRFLLDTLPGFNNVLNNLWMFYGSHFAHHYVKDYILNVIHENFMLLPWEKFFPSLSEVELMLHIVNQFLPSSHSFVGNIFINVKWNDLVQYHLSGYDGEIAAKLHICLLHLLVKLSMEPSLKQNEKIICLLNEANDFGWHLVDSCSYEIILNWFITSCDPRIILMDERMEYYKLDSTIFRLLQTCSGYTTHTKLFHPTSLAKRSLFVKACVKWLISSNRRFKYRDSQLFKEALQTMWDVMDSVITETTSVTKGNDETIVLFREFLAIFTEPGLSSVAEDTLCEWLSSRKSQAIVYGLMYSTGTTIDNPKLYGRIMESILENYFGFIDNSNWAEVLKIKAPSAESNCQLEKVLIDNKYFLTLYSTLLKKVKRNENYSNSKLVLTDMLHLLAEVKVSTTSEPKVLLLILFTLNLIETEMQLTEKDGISLLIRLSTILKGFVESKENGFLSAVGLTAPAFSNRFRLICLGVCGGISIMLKNYPEHYQADKEEKILQALESIETNKIYQNINQYALYVKTAISGNCTIEDIIKFMRDLGVKLFNTLYLK